jgi:phytol kinase
MIGNNWIALVLTFGLALVWLRFNDFLAHRGVIDGQLSRKLIHTGTGPIFVLCWLFFNSAPESRYLAALVPFAITVQFALVGLGIMKDPEAVAAMSRSGDRREILRGPLFYGIVFVLITIIYWRDSPIGITALMLLCGGDGLADIVGKRLKTPNLPWSPRKTMAGSAAVFLAGWVFAAFVFWVYQVAGVLSVNLNTLLLPLTWISLAGAAVESLPFQDIDNLTVPAAAILLGHLLF